MLPALKIPWRVRIPVLGEDALSQPWTSVRWLDGRAYPLGLWRRYLLVAAAASLSCTVLLKIAEIQYLEFIFAFDFLGLVAVFLWQRMRLQVYPPLLDIARSYAIFMVCAFVLSLFALQQQFTHSLHVSFLHSRVVVTLSRIAELFLDAFYMLYLASLYREDRRLCRFGANVYLLTGLAGCLYAFVTWPLNFFYGMDYGTALAQHRFRGFNNEAGGFGIYLVSVAVMAIVMYRQRWLSLFHFRVTLAILVVGLVGSQSKSAYFATALLAVICLIWFLRGVRRFIAFGVLCGSLTVVGSLINIQQQVDQYRRGSMQYRKLSNLRWGDANFVMGRISGAVIAPRMIAERPFLGVGWGNYPIVRDDPDYRQGTAFELSPVDAPSLGIVDYIVELGIPLWIYLTWIELKPVMMLRRRGADPALLALALIQPISNWAGDHLNLMHPWIAAGFALGLGYSSFSASQESSSPEYGA